MRRFAIFTLSAALCVLPSAVPLTAADKPAKTAATHSAAVRSVWPPETLSGKISMVDPARNLVVVDDSSGIPFDMTITPRTRIESGDQALSLQDLSQYRNKSVSI